MDKLPFSPQMEIFSHLNLNEQAICRLVCYNLKCSIECNLKTISHIKVQDNFNLEDAHSSIRDKFLSRKFVKAEVTDHKEYLSNEFFSFIKYCTNLQVLCARFKYFTFDNLVKLPGLRYFRGYQLEPLPIDTPEIFFFTYGLFGSFWC